MQHRVWYRMGVATTLAAAGALGMVATGSTAEASSGAGLMLSPWQAEQQVELDADFFLQGKGDVRRSGGESIRLNTFESTGRLRLDPTDRRSPAVGYDFYQLELSHDVGGLPERLSDQSVAVGFGLTEWEGWEIGATAGFGFAGDRPYSDSDAWYAKANLIASRQLDDRSSLQLLLNYDGNRTIFPDVPLPGIAYNHELSDTFRYTAGIPYSAITWQPAQRFTLDLAYTIPYTVNATGTYDLTDSLDLFAGFYNRFRAFHQHGDVSNRRVFFRQRRIEGGVRYGRGVNWELVAAAGFAFDQELRRGWDTRDLSNPTKFSSEPYLRLGFDVSF